MTKNLIVILFCYFLMIGMSLAKGNETLKRTLLDEALLGAEISTYYEDYRDEHVLLIVDEFAMKIHGSLTVRYEQGRINISRLYLGSDYLSYIRDGLVLPDYNFISNFYVGEYAESEYNNFINYFDGDVNKCTKINDYDINKYMVDSAPFYFVRSESAFLQFSTENIQDLEYMLDQDEIIC